jgi:hypothetical protein
MSVTVTVDQLEKAAENSSYRFVLTKLYAASLQATLGNFDASSVVATAWIENGRSPAVHFMEVAQNYYPPSDGWHSHDVGVMEVEAENGGIWR